MKKLSQFLLFLLIIIVVSYGGLLVGRHVSNMSEPPTAEEQRIADEKQAAKQARKEQKRLEEELKKLKDKADYVAAPSTFGPLIKIQQMDVKFQEGEAIALIKKDNATDLQNGQRVVLYYKEDENYAMPLGGAIKYLNNENGKRKVVIELPEGTNTEFLSNKVGVITEQTIVSQRIPLSALMKNKEGGSVIWLAEELNGKFTATPKQIEKADENEEFFVPVGSDIGPYTLIITNPDKYLRTDKEYELFKTEINGPVMNPIDQAYIDFQQHVFETRQAELHKIAEDCFNGKQELDAVEGSNSSTTSCGATQNEEDIMFEIFQSLTTSSQQIDASGCGQSNSACGQ